MEVEEREDHRSPRRPTVAAAGRPCSSRGTPSTPSLVLTTAVCTTLALASRRWPRLHAVASMRGSDDDGRIRRGSCGDRSDVDRREVGPSDGPREHPSELEQAVRAPLAIGRLSPGRTRRAGARAVRGGPCPRLAALNSPVAALDPRVEPRVHEHDGFVVTLSTYYQPVADRAPPPRTMQTRSSGCILR